MERYTPQLYMGTAEAQTRLPRPRTDQYFNSGGSKHLAEQLLLKSFTHSMGTPPPMYAVCVCEQIPGPSKLPQRRQWSETSFSFLFFFFLNLYLFSCCHASSFFFSYTWYTYYTESVPVISPFGRPKGVGGRQRKRHSQGEKKNK